MSLFADLMVLAKFLKLASRRRLLRSLRSSDRPFDIGSAGV